MQRRTFLVHLLPLHFTTSSRLGAFVFVLLNTWLKSRLPKEPIGELSGFIFGYLRYMRTVACRRYCFSHLIAFCDWGTQRRPVFPSLGNLRLLEFQLHPTVVRSASYFAKRYTHRSFVDRFFCH
ncbi:hypothetical protein Tcan_00704, partial [Toxocara canis]